MYAQLHEIRTNQIQTRQLIAESVHEPSLDASITTTNHLAAAFALAPFQLH
jgi:hypothetical protein